VTTKITDVQQGDGSTAPDLSALADQLVAAARTQGVELTGPGGLLTGLTKQVLETALDVELGGHLGHDHGERSGSGNVGNGAARRRCAPTWSRSGLPCQGIERARSARRWCPSTRVGWLASTAPSSPCYAKGMTTGDNANHRVNIN
jgi:putative transposase